MTDNGKWSFIIEGNIGAGKSTLCEQIGKKLPCDIVQEPVNKWTHMDDSDSENILMKFYKDKTRWGYTFQNMAFLTRVQAIQQPCSYPVRFIERSIYTDKNCFAKNCHKDKQISDLEWYIYKNWFSWLEEQFKLKPCGFIYLRATPDVCLERINTRGRSEEKKIEIEYLQSLHEYHEDWLGNNSKLEDETPILVVDGNTNFQDDEKELDTIISQIMKFVWEITFKKT